MTKLPEERIAEIPTCSCSNFWKYHHPDCPTVAHIASLEAEVQELREECERLREQESLYATEGAIVYTCEVEALTAENKRLRAALEGRRKDHAKDLMACADFFRGKLTMRQLEERITGGTESE